MDWELIFKLFSIGMGIAGFVGFLKPQWHWVIKTVLFTFGMLGTVGAVYLIAVDHLDSKAVANKLTIAEDKLDKLGLKLAEASKERYELLLKNEELKSDVAVAEAKLATKIDQNAVDSVRDLKSHMARNARKQRFEAEERERCRPVTTQNSVMYPCGF